MNRCIARLMILTGSTSLAAVWGSAEAGDWMFRRSFYSHDSSPDGPASQYGSSGTGQLDYSAPIRTEDREPWVGGHPHSAVRSGWRYNSFVLHNGTSTETTSFRKNCFDRNYSDYD